MPVITYKNTPVYFEVKGEGRAVVLLHGFLENRSMWKDIAAELCKRYKVVSIDLFGHGGTGNLGYIHTMEAQAHMVKQVLDTLNLRRYVLVGHSMGGYISLALAEEYPDNIKGLCLLNSTAMEDTDEKKMNRDRAIVRSKKPLPKTFVKICHPKFVF
ncbi:MAG: alpha/beta fold hydrolase [Flavobacteriaceae bacterium]|nr:alpha/beta fold hydrolase [Flavobacteriaceae bacterium]